MPMLDRPDTRIYLDDAGEGPALLLTHGFSASSQMFDGNVAALTHGRRLVRWDVRGHGRSDYPTDPRAYSPELAVGDMLAILDHLGIECAAIGGHSLGGYLSLEFVLAHPDRVEALVLIDTGPGYRKDEARDGWNRMAIGYAKDLEANGLQGLPASEELRADVHRDAAGLALAARGILVQRDSHVLDALHTIDVPTLVIVGSEDTAFIPGSEHMARKIPNARLVVIDGAGHAPNISQPAVFDAELRTFLDAAQPVTGR